MFAACVSIGTDEKFSCVNGNKNVALSNTGTKGFIWVRQEGYTGQIGLSSLKNMEICDILL